MAKIASLDTNETSSNGHLVQLNIGEKKEEKKVEKWYSQYLQIVIPFLIAGFGMVSAGILFKEVQEWELYKKVSEVNILVPALLGLKGNLEMTLAARLSTQVNLGRLNDKKAKLSAALGNIALTQVQSIVVGFLASFVACIMSLILEGKVNSDDILILISSSVTTASVASLLLGTAVILIILLAKYLNMNPDNIATPIAASLGDVVTLGILSGIGTVYYIFRNINAVPICMIVFFILIVPFLAFYCFKNDFVKETLFQGWIPIILAMFISSIAGIILERGIKLYPGIAVYQPVVNGIGGNLVAIYASRLSTVLYETSKMGSWATWSPPKYYLYVKEAFIGKRNPESRTALMLSSLILPGHLIFFFTIYFVDRAINESMNNQNQTDLSASLVLFYLLFVFFQVEFLLLLCYFLVHLAWRWRKNPDNYCIPVLTATGDLLGVSLLLLCFYLTYVTGNQSVVNSITQQTVTAQKFTLNLKMI